MIERRKSNLSPSSLFLSFSLSLFLFPRVFFNSPVDGGVVTKSLFSHFFSASPRIIARIEPLTAARALSAASAAAAGVATEVSPESCGKKPRALAAPPTRAVATAQAAVATPRARACWCGVEKKKR